jgi:hypothetical protein
MAKVTGIGSRGKAPATAAAAAPAIDQATLDKIGEETRSLGRVDRVFHWDKRQAAQVWAAADGHILSPEELDADAQAETLYATSHALGDVRPTLRRHHLVQAPTVLVCGHDKAHGRLIINGAGTLLLCSATKGGAACTYNQPVSI